MNKSIALLPLLVSATTALPGTRPITHEDLWLMKLVGAPVVSPDGKSVYASNRGTPTISQYSRNTETGKLTALSPATSRPAQP